MSAPKIRVIKARLSGEGDDAGAVAELLARLLPALSEGRCQVGEISPAYPNRRGTGARRYFDLYLINPDTTGRTGTEDRPGARPPLPG
ncbi:hypothetical protein ACH35V_06800 [Actinomadura sp. 1N219]|uniref:hypothetical protein n=1 Tax=Actinomadura sp. 1N219 TaxID=3375152 RepID=UPI00378CA7B4